VIKPGEEWGGPATGPPDLEVRGTDADLAREAFAQTGALIKFAPTEDSDLARAVGLSAAHSTGVEVPLDLLQVGDRAAVNMVVVGVPPDRCRPWTRRREVRVRVDDQDGWAGLATTVVIAVGQFRHGLDLVPRGHPGDGWAEVQVYALPPKDRTAMRARLGTGGHVPHPAIKQRRGRVVSVESAHALAVEADGEPAPWRDPLVVRVCPNAYRLLL
jgi:hypothetical protein